MDMGDYRQDRNIAKSLKFSVSDMLEELRLPGSETRTIWLSLWWPLVTLYSGCDLSRISDRWTAVLGLAKLFSAVSDSCLIFGLWEGRLAADLSWRTTDPGPDRLVNENTLVLALH